MPVRALRLLTKKTRACAKNGPKTINARKGVKTGTPVGVGVVSGTVSPKTINARKGVKTHRRPQCERGAIAVQKLSMPVRALRLEIAEAGVKA